MAFVGIWGAGGDTKSFGRNSIFFSIARSVHPIYLMGGKDERELRNQGGTCNRSF